MINWSGLKDFLRKSGPCVDSARFLEKVSDNRLLRLLCIHLLRFRFTPEVLVRIYDEYEAGPLLETAFSRAISQVCAGRTYKTTARGRNKLADAAIISMAGDFDSPPSVLEVGVSDGSSAMELLAQKETFSKVVLSDRHALFSMDNKWGVTRFFDGSGRFLGVKLPGIYLHLAAFDTTPEQDAQTIDTMNPAVRGLAPDADIKQFDMLSDAVEPVQIIKCANILNRAYFSPKMLRQALANLSRSLELGGRLVVSHNNAKYEDGESYFVLQKEESGMRLVEDHGNHESVGLFFEGADEEAGKVIFLVPSLDAGGAERQLVVLANSLASRGWDVGIALFRKQGELLDELSERVRVHDLRKGGKLDITGFLVRLARLIRQEQPDALVPYLGVPCMAATLLKPLLSGRLIWSVRQAAINMADLEPLARWCYAVERRISPLADAIVINSMAGKQHAVEQGFPEKRIHVIPNGIDTERFQPNRELGKAFREQCGCDEDDILIGLVARLDPLKDHPTFLRAAERLAKQEKNVRFVCVGGGRLEASLKTQAEQMGLTPYLHWAGTVRDMPAVYNGLDICCLSSITEGFPNVLGEAMACGVPCVSTDVGDAAYLMEDAGVVVPKSDAEALEQGMAKLVKAVRSNTVAPTRERITDNFSLETMVANTIKVIRD